MAGVIEIALIDDHPMARQGIASIIEREDGFRVVAEGRTADDAVAIATQRKPDIILLDIDIAGGGIAATRAIAKAAAGGRTAVIVLTEDESEDAVCAALEAGARGYLPKSRHQAELARVIRAVANGENYVSPDLAGRLLLGRAARNMIVSTNDRSALLAARDEQIMRLVSRGYSNREIASQLHIPETIIAGCVARVVDRIAAIDRLDQGHDARRLYAGSMH
jgi:two-component system, NarL family, nitrate/nitrite response regulator NarL